MVVGRSRILNILELIRNYLEFIRASCYLVQGIKESIGLSSKREDNTSQT